MFRLNSVLQIVDEIPTYMQMIKLIDQGARAKGRFSNGIENKTWLRLVCKACARMVLCAYLKRPHTWF